MFATRLCILLSVSFSPLLLSAPNCLAGASITFILTPEARLTSPLSELTRDVTQTDCERSCAADSSCLAYVYWTRLRECERHRTSVTRGHQLADQPGSVYAQKFVVEDQPTGCDHSYERFAQLVLVGFAEHVEQPTTLDDCLRRCTRLDDCQSAMFFYDLDQCVLNTAASGSHPELLERPSPRDVVVDYFELRCIERQREEGRWEAWTEWTDCSAAKATRTRTRRCRGATPCRGAAVETTACSVAAPSRYYTNDCRHFSQAGYASYSDCIRGAYSRTS